MTKQVRVRVIRDEGELKSGDTVYMELLDAFKAARRGVVELLACQPMSFSLERETR